MFETCSVDGLFNALQFETSVYDIRSKDDYNKSHTINATNLPDDSSIDVKFIIITKNTVYIKYKKL